MINSVTLYTEQVHEHIHRKFSKKHIQTKRVIKSLSIYHNDEYGRCIKHEKYVLRNYLPHALVNGYEIQ